MKTRRFSAWQFVLPTDVGTDESAAAGLQVAPTGTIALVDEHASVRQAILLLLSTSPGERVMRPRYGCELHRLVFAPNDDTTAGLAMHFVRQAIARWEPRVEVLRLDAGRNLDATGPLPGSPRMLETDSVLDIYLEYRIRATQRTDRLLFSFNLAGEQV